MFSFSIGTLVLFTAPVFHDMYISGNESKKVYLFYRELSNYYREENFVNGGLDLNYGMVARICTVSYNCSKYCIYSIVSHDLSNVVAACNLKSRTDVFSDALS